MVVVEPAVFTEGEARSEESAAEGEVGGYSEASIVTAENVRLTVDRMFKPMDTYMHCQRWTAADTANMTAKTVGAPCTGA